MPLFSSIGKGQPSITWHHACLCLLLWTNLILVSKSGYYHIIVYHEGESSIDIILSTRWKFWEDAEEMIMGKSTSVHLTVVLSMQMFYAITVDTKQCEQRGISINSCTFRLFYSVYSQITKTHTQIWPRSTGPGRERPWAMKVISVSLMFLGSVLGNFSQYTQTVIYLLISFTCECI